ncbi:MAG TPA: cytochrome c oxidase assembly protein [Acidimicrobiales bacterium]|jgi:putative membrane protein|nr:cytochrome c oxidase assembly protein [Acidimicrobiales bacterium]
MGTAGPYTWDPHLVTWSVLVALGALVVFGHRRLEQKSDHPIPWTRRQMVAFGGAWVTTAVALTWPVANVAAHWSLTALVVQRLLLLLLASPLLVLGLPYDLVQWLTRPRIVDTVLLRLQQPPVAIVVVSVLVVGSMMPKLVRAQASSLAVRGLVDIVIVVAGLILWMPVLGRVPGILRLRPVVRFGYLVAQAVVPAFLSFILIFSAHPLYVTFARSHAAVGLRPLNDQQIAGIVSKVSMLLVLLIVGAVVLARAPVTEEELARDEPLVWADVERQFERVDRRQARPRRSASPDDPDRGDQPAEGRNGRGSGSGGTGAPPDRRRRRSDHPQSLGDSRDGEGPDGS